MGVFSRLFSRQGGAAEASSRDEVGSEGEASEADNGSVDAAIPEIELAPEVITAGKTDTTGLPDMSKPATAPGESAVWRSDRVSSTADSDPTNSQPSEGSQSSAVRGAPRQQRRTTDTDDVSGTTLPRSAPRVRLTSDLVPRGLYEEDDDAELPALTGDDPRTAGASDPTSAVQAASAIDAALSHWMDVNASADSTHGSTAEQVDDRAWLDTFSSIAKLHIQPLRELMYHLSTGCTPRAWVQQTRPVLAPLFDAAEQSGAAELLDALSELDTALELAIAEPTALVGPVSRGAIQQAYARLGVHLPDAFGPPRSSDGRRLLLLEALLLQVPNVHRRVVTKLYAAGIGSIQQLLQGSADELSRATGIERQLAGTILEHVKRFALEREGLESVRLRSRINEQLTTLVARLGQLQTEFERADGADDQVRKKAVRRARDASVLELQRLVAELGEVDLLEELRRCSVRAKVARMQSYLQDSARSC